MMPSLKRRELLESATRQYQQSVGPALPYLMKRGIDESTAKRWRLGFVEEPAPGHGRMVGRLSIPYLSPSGVLSMKFRCIADHKCDGHMKYYGEEGDPTFLFAAGSVIKSTQPTVCVCEGEFDTITAISQVGLTAVGVSGATKWKSHWSYIFEAFEEVVVFLDGDSPKEREDGKITPPASEIFGRIVRNAVPHSRTVQLPLGHDVNSFVMEHGPDELRKVAGLDAVPA